MPDFLVIDPTPLDSIRSLEEPGCDELLLTIVGLFNEQSVDLCERIRVAVQTGNADGIREAAHSLKSSSANVGAMRVSALSYDLEVAGRDGVLEHVNALTDRLELAIGEANAALALITEHDAA